MKVKTWNPDEPLSMEVELDPDEQNMMDKLLGKIPPGKSIDLKLEKK